MSVDFPSLIFGVAMLVFPAFAVLASATGTRNVRRQMRPSR